MQKYLGLKQEPKTKPVDCDICGIIKCNRHLTAPDREPWRRLFITHELDGALASVCFLSHFIFNLKREYTTLSLFSVLHKDFTSICG